VHGEQSIKTAVVINIDHPLVIIPARENVLSVKGMLNSKSNLEITILYRHSLKGGVLYKKAGTGMAFGACLSGYAWIATRAR
jgi:hypothetical protein